MNDTKEKPPKTKPEKFLFDLNCFDEDYEEEVVEEAPPPPTFSEDELAAARDDGFKRGQREGHAEAEASREKHVATLLGTINQACQQLFIEEQRREEQYEAEVLLVVRAIFSRIFPTLNAQYGLSEVEAVVASVLESSKEGHEIKLQVHPDYSESIRQRLEQVTAALPASCRINVTGNEALGPGDCRMQWDDGGAERNITAIAEEIHRQLEHILAERPSLQDNRIEDIEDDLPPEDDTTNGDDL